MVLNESMYYWNWWQRHSSTYCWTRNMQSKRNSSFAVYSSNSEQALLCLRQLHFYDHNLAFFSALFMLMCIVLKKLSQWSTPAGVSFPPCQNAIFQWLWWVPFSAGIDQHYCIQCGRTVAPEHQQRKFLNLWIKCLGSTQGKACGSTGAMLVPALQIYYYNIIMVNIIKPPTIGLFVYCTTTGITPTTDSLFCWHKTVFHVPARSGIWRCNHWKRLYGKLWGMIWILNDSSYFCSAPGFLLILHILECVAGTMDLYVS